MSTRANKLVLFVQILTVAIGILTLVNAVVHTVWSYKCRSTGTFCEGSFVAPAINQATKDSFIRKLASPNGQKNFDGLTLRERGYWLFGKRFDVVASFKDGTEIAIDTVPAERVSKILAVEKNAIAAFLEHTEVGNGTRMVAYFPGSSIAKRVFEFGSPYSAKGEIKISNLSYDANSRSLTLDLVSRESSVELNNNANNKFEIRHLTPSEKYGATVVVELSDDYHVRRAYDLANKREYEKSEFSLQECKKESASESDMTEGQLVACFENQTDDLTTQQSELLIFEWDGSRFSEVASTSCSFCYWSVDKSHKAVFVSEDRAQQTGKAGVDRRLSIYKRPFDRERTLWISGACKAFDIYEISYMEDRAISFQLTTDCARVEINNRRIDFRPQWQDGTKLTGYYALTLDAYDLPRALIALSPTADSQ